MNKFILSIILTATALTAHADSTLLGVGNVPCGKYLQMSKNPSAVVDANVWVLGYLSGVNIVRGHSDFLKNTDSDAIEAAVTLYCRENPLDHLWQAAFSVGIRLSVQNGETVDSWRKSTKNE